MNNRRFILAVLIVTLAIAGLMYSAVTATAKTVHTVDELVMRAPMELSRIRLGARVTEQPINYQTTPKAILEFFVRDIKSQSGDSVPVVYYGIMPDTLQAGRDVILEGDFDGNKFVAKSLLTQCPSKYEPPLPGEESSRTHG